MILQHPERMAAAAPAVTNYAGRCLTLDSPRSSADRPSGNRVPVEAGRDVMPGKFATSNPSKP